MRLKKVFYNRQRKSLKLKRNEVKLNQNLKRITNKQFRNKKIKTKLLKIKMKMLWQFYKQQFKIFCKKLFTKLKMESGTFMINKKANGFNNNKSQLKKCKK